MISSEGEEDEDLDDIMGDLLGPYHPKTPLSESSGSNDTNHGKRHESSNIRSLSSSRSHSSSNGTGLTSPGEREAATIITLELLELMLGNTELPEIEVPNEQGDGAEESGVAEVVEEEVEAAAPTVFPTTGLFSSPLIATPSRNATALVQDPSLPSMSEINELLSQ
jgi:hypothetical protein